MISIISSITLLLSFTYQATAACNETVTRREIRDLSEEQRTAYLRAIKKLHDPKNDIFTEFTSTHLVNSPQAHGVSGFFPWHRYFIREYEKKLQSIDSSVILPYWDWTIDSQAPEESIIFTEEYFGGNGREKDHCVTDGTFADWSATIPNDHCLKRQFNNGTTISAWYSKESIEVIIRQTKTYDAFRTAIEGGPHNSVHVGIGGKTGDMNYMHSPNDPLFYLHHAFIDMLWFEWQSRDPVLGNTYDGGAVKITDNMIPFNVKVEDAMDVDDFCYTYPRFGTDLPELAPTDPKNNQTETGTRFGISKFVTNFSARSKSGKSNPTDGSTRRKLKIPLPLPEGCVKSNNLDVKRLRAHEAALANFTMALNAMAGF